MPRFRLLWHSFFFEILYDHTIIHTLLLKFALILTCEWIIYIYIYIYIYGTLIVLSENNNPTTTYYMSKLWKYARKSNHIKDCKIVQNTKVKVVNFTYFNPKNTYFSACKIVYIYKLCIWYFTICFSLLQFTCTFASLKEIIKKYKRMNILLNKLLE